MNEPTTTEAINETQAVELEMKRLQCERLRAEIRDVALAWWQRPGYIASAAPIVLAVFGIFTAWVTGFFNREREVLRIEIAKLSDDKAKLDQATTLAEKELSAALERTRELQKFNDEVYIKVKFHSAGADYAASMIKADGQEAWVSSKDIEVAAKSLEQLPPVDRDKNARILQQYKLSLEMIDEVHKSMKSANQLLNAIPASKRVKRLQLTVAPDHDFIDPVTRKTYSIKTIDEFLRGAD